MKVILWGQEDLLGWAFEGILAARKEWEVIRIPEQQKIDFLIQTVEKVNPDVVIVYQGDCTGDVETPVRLLLNRPGVKLVTVSLEDNSLDVYNKKKVWITQVADLLSVIENSISS